MQKKAVSLLLFLLTAGFACKLGTPGAAPRETPAETAGASAPVPTVTAEPAAAGTATDIPGGFFPIAVGSSYQPGAAVLLGGAEDGAWLDAENAAARMSGGEAYTLYSSGGPVGTVAGSKPVRDKICPQYLFDWSPAPSAVSLVGMGGPWNALPRIPQPPAVSEYPIYTSAAGDWLAGRGMPVPNPLRLTNVVRADLDGDGTMEAIISASRFLDGNGHDVAAGDFSFVLLYRESAAETILLAGDVYPASESLVFPSAYSLLSILDLNGDGRMEVIVHVGLWEGEGTLVFSADGDSVQAVLDTKCSV
jgi:hypothetical protein